MARRIVTAVAILLALILPISGSTATPDSIAIEVIQSSEVIETPNAAPPYSAETAPVNTPAGIAPAVTPCPTQTVPVTTPDLTEAAPTATPDLTGTPAVTPCPTQTAPVTTQDPTETVPPATPDPVQTTPPATPDPVQTTSPATPEPTETTPDNDPGVISDYLPPIDETNADYIAFKDETAAIIKKAEDESGIRSVYGVFIMDLSNGYYCGINENLTRTDPDDNAVDGYFNSASVIKLFQGYILCDMIRQGELDVNETYYDEVTGRRFKLLNLITTMISRSDNNYSNAVLRLIGNKKANEVLTRLGIYNSKIYGEMSGATGYSQSNNIKKYGTSKRCARLTPRDAGLILYNVYMNRETDLYMKTMNKALLGNIYNTRIPVGVARVSASYGIAHKTGTNSELGVYNDAGIIYCKHPFILISFTQSTSVGAGQGFIRNLAEELTRYFDAKK